MFPAQRPQSHMNQLPPILSRRKRVSRQRFSPEQDALICELVGTDQYPNWSEIARHIPNKTAKQVRERYQHYLSPEISQQPWTEQDQQLLEILHGIYGSDWARLAHYFPGRTNSFLKNQWNAGQRAYARQTRALMELHPPLYVVQVGIGQPGNQSLH